MENTDYILSNSSVQTTKPWLKPLLLGFVAVIFAVLFTVAGYQLAQNKTAKQTVTSTSVASPTPNPVANWQTYTNPQYGFSFKYPSTWFIKNLTCCISPTTNLDAEFINDNSSVDSNQNQRISVVLNDEDITQAIDSLNSNGGGVKTQMERTSTTLAGKQIEKLEITQTVYQDSEKTTPAGTNQFYIVFIPFQSHVIRITSWLEDKNIVDQILSTFKFTK